MSSTTLNAQLSMPTTPIDVPVTVNIGGGGSAPVAPKRSLGWLWGVLGTFAVLALLGGMARYNNCATPAPAPTTAPAPIDYSPFFGRLEQKMDQVANGTAQVLTGLGDLEVDTANNGNLLRAMARRGEQTGQAVDRIGGVQYDAAGNVVGTQTIAEAIAAATRAEKARSRTVRVEVPAQVDMDAINARFNELQRELHARPTLERLNP